jgi:hypothetical protein
LANHLDGNIRREQEDEYEDDLDDFQGQLTDQH